MDIKEIITKIKYIDGGAILSLADKIPAKFDIKGSKKKVAAIFNADNLDAAKSKLRLVKDILGWVPQWFQSILPF